MNRLITIPFSHYCEKARWALDRTGVPYVEEAHAPVLHYTGSLRGRGGRTVPVLHLDGKVLRDSTDILDALDARAPGSLWPKNGDAAAEAREWEERFDKTLGPAVRRLMYFHVLQAPDAAKQVLASGPIPAWQKRVVGAGFGLMKRLLTRGLNIDAKTAARSRGRLDEIFAEVTAHLAGGRRYLAGNSFSAADLTFASLASIVLAPPEHANYAKREEMPDGARDVVDAYRATPAGEFGMRLYREERSARARSTDSVAASAGK